MPHSFRGLFVASTLNVLVGLALDANATAEPAKPPAQDAAVAAIERLGGRVPFDDTGPRRPA